MQDAYNNIKFTIFYETYDYYHYINKFDLSNVKHFVAKKNRSSIFQIASGDQFSRESTAVTVSQNIAYNNFPHIKQIKTTCRPSIAAWWASFLCSLFYIFIYIFLLFISLIFMSTYSIISRYNFLILLLILIFHII